MGKQRVTRQSAEVYWKARRAPGNRQSLPILFPDNAGKQWVTRKNPEIYWKQETGFSL
jgi:hypothetical protein